MPNPIKIIAPSQRVNGKVGKLYKVQCQEYIWEVFINQIHILTILYRVYFREHLFYMSHFCSTLSIT